MAFAVAKRDARRVMKLECKDTNFPRIIDYRQPHLLKYLLIFIAELIYTFSPGRVTSMRISLFSLPNIDNFNIYYLSCVLLLLISMGNFATQNK